MPHSYHYGKSEAIEFIQKHTTPESKILDVGPGVGTYADYLKPLGYHIDGLEIYDGYVDAYNLKEKYKNIYIGDIVTYDISDYDFVIIGDVLEHLTIEDSHNVLSRCKNVLVAVPYICPQGGVDFYHNEHHLINPYEAHQQSDLTPLEMLTRYPDLGLVWSNHLYGYYSNIKWNGYYA
jgi:SAM-dependent methyltransferase